MRNYTTQMDAMADARSTFDWEKQWECSMCGKFCAVRSMNKALNAKLSDNS